MTAQQVEQREEQPAVTNTNENIPTTLAKLVVPIDGLTKDNWDEYNEGSGTLYTDFIRIAYERALHDDVPVYQWHADTRRGLLIEAWEANGLLQHQTITWVKTLAVLTRSHFMWQHEPCLYGWKQGSQPTSGRRPPADAKSVWDLSNAKRNDVHPTEKPVEIFAWPLRWHLKRGEIAYEPFSGSGSQIIAAEMEQRACYAMELAPQYVDVAARRWQEHTGQLPVNAATGEPHDFTSDAGAGDEAA